MDLVAQRRIFDVFTRQAMFIEMVKADEAVRLDQLLKEIDDDLRKNLARIEYATLDGMSKAKVKAFILALRASQTRIYSRYQQELINRLSDFMKAVVKQTVIVSASLHAHVDLPPEIEADEQQEPEPVKELTFQQASRIVERDGSNSLFGLALLTGSTAAFIKLWSRIVNLPMPSSGILLVNTINTTFASAMVSTEQAVYKAWVNKATIAELIKAVVNANKSGTAPDGSASVARKIRNALNGTVATVMQHVAQQAINAGASALWPEYVWVSVLDHRTSDICRYRNDKTYVYGQGPLPPAHNYCRSHVMPKDTDPLGFKIPSLFEWLKMQPRGFLDACFGATIANKFVDGSIKASDFENFRPTRSISIAEFIERTSDLL